MLHLFEVGLVFGAGLGIGHYGISAVLAKAEALIKSLLAKIKAFKL